jgi:hypothetical protein
MEITVLIAIVSGIIAVVSVLYTILRNSRKDSAAGANVDAKQDIEMAKIITRVDNLEQDVLELKTSVDSKYANLEAKIDKVYEKLDELKIQLIEIFTKK